MLFSFAAFALVSALTVSATDFNVRVGDNNQLVFNPPSVMAQLGDTVRFQFVSKNHSVTESSFATPCTQASNGVDSGFLAFDNSSSMLSSWSFTLNTTTPLWFFCAQTTPVSHCQSGMVFAVNPTADKTFEAYQNNAKNSASSNATAGAGGAAGASGSSSAAVSFPIGSASGSGFSTALSSAASTAAAAGGTAAAASVAPTTNGAVVVGTTRSVVGVSVVTLFAAVAGFLL